MKNLKSFFSAGFFFSIFPLSVFAQPIITLPKPDSAGWINLFRGNNASDFYIVYNGGTIPPAQDQHTFPDKTFTMSGDTIMVTGSPQGQVYFKQPFTYYKVRYEMHYPGSIGNSGMLTHIQQNDAPANGYPVSVESQGDPTQGMGEVWPIGDVWITVRAHQENGNMQYFPTDSEIVYGGADWNHRVVAGKDGWGKPDYATLAAKTGWVTQEVDSYGTDGTKVDSIVDIVQDSVRIKYRLPRISHGGTPNNVSKYLGAGLIAWQSEGSVCWYRHLQIKLFPQDPLYTYMYGSTGIKSTQIVPNLAPKSIITFQNGTLMMMRGSHAPVSGLGREIPSLNILKPQP